MNAPKKGVINLEIEACELYFNYPIFLAILKVKNTNSDQKRVHRT